MRLFRLVRLGCRFDVFTCWVVESELWQISIKMRGKKLSRYLGCCKYE